jgi:ketosteroid isomerase-like protein
MTTESTAMAERETETRNKQAVHAAFDAWRNGLAGNVFDLLAPDAKWTIVGNAPVSRTYASRQEFLDVVIKPFNARDHSLGGHQQEPRSSADRRHCRTRSGHLLASIPRSLACPDKGG